MNHFDSPRSLGRRRRRPLEPPGGWCPSSDVSSSSVFKRSARRRARGGRRALRVALITVFNSLASLWGVGAREHKAPFQLVFLLFFRAVFSRFDRKAPAAGDARSFVSPARSTCSGCLDRSARQAVPLFVRAPERAPASPLRRLSLSSRMPTTAFKSERLGFVSG